MAGCKHACMCTSYFYMWMCDRKCLSQLNIGQKDTHNCCWKQSIFVYLLSITETAGISSSSAPNNVNNFIPNNNMNMQPPMPPHTLGMHRFPPMHGGKSSDHYSLVYFVSFHTHSLSPSLSLTLPHSLWILIFK